MTPAELIEFVSFIQTLGFDFTKLPAVAEIRPLATKKLPSRNDYCIKTEEVDKFIIQSVSPGNIDRIQLYKAYEDKFKSIMTDYEKGVPVKGGVARYKARIYTRLEVLLKNRVLKNKVLGNTYTAS